MVAIMPTGVKMGTAVGVIIGLVYNDHESLMSAESEFMTKSWVS